VSDAALEVGYLFAEIARRRSETQVDPQSPLGSGGSDWEYVPDAFATSMPRSM
jgi:hypothetical protein